MRVLIAPFCIAGLLVGCGAAPSSPPALPVSGERSLEIGSPENQLTLPGGVRQLSIPVTIIRTPSEAMTLVVGRGAASGQVELVERCSGDKQEGPHQELVAQLLETLKQQRQGL